MPLLLCRSGLISHVASAPDLLLGLFFGLNNSVMVIRLGSLWIIVDHILFFGRRSKNRIIFILLLIDLLSALQDLLLWLSSFHSVVGSYTSAEVFTLS
jgi:hypothetical protein